MIHANKAPLRASVLQLATNTVGVWSCTKGYTPAPPKRGGPPCSLAGVGIRVRPWLARGMSGGKSTPQGAVNHTRLAQTAG